MADLAKQSRDHPLPMAEDRLRAVQEAIDSLEQEGGIPLEEIEAWIESWGTPGELPPPQPRK